MSTEHVHDVFESIAAQYDAANDRISFCMHRAWKKALVDRLVAAAVAGDPGEVLDVCCGTGDIAEAVAQRSPGTLAVGLDFSKGMLDVARERTAALDNVFLVEGDACRLPFDAGEFDAAAISFGLRNTPDYEQVVREMVRVTRPGGVVACLDASVPDHVLVRPIYQLYYKHIMTRLGGGAARRAEYQWLYDSTQAFLSKSELEELFRSCGLEYVTVRPFMFGAAALHVGVVPYKAA